jgi:tetratricopeptide (TPR) repeat protein
VLQAFQKALAIRQKQADAHPAVADFQSEVAASHSGIGYVLSRIGRLDEALESHQKALAIRQKLADANPAVTKYQRTTAQSRNLIGRLLAREQRFAESFAVLDAGLATRQKLAEGDPKNADYASDLAYSYAYRGWARVRAGRHSEAAADLRQAVGLWTQARAPNAETRFERSRTLALLAGLGAEPTSGVTKAEAARFADEAVASLGDAVHSGWNQPDELAEHDFDALREREDYKKSVAEMEANAQKPREKP